MMMKTNKKIISTTKLFIRTYSKAFDTLVPSSRDKINDL